MKTLLVLPPSLLDGDDARALIIALQSRFHMTQAVCAADAGSLTYYQEAMPDAGARDLTQIADVLNFDLILHLESGDGKFGYDLDDRGCIVFRLAGEVPRHDQITEAVAALRARAPVTAGDLGSDLLRSKPENTQILFAVTAPMPGPLHLKILYRIAERKFNNVGKIWVAAPGDILGQVKAILGDMAYCPLDEALASPDFGVLVAVSAALDYNQIDYPWARQDWARKFVYAATPPPEFNRLYFDKSGAIFPMIENIHAGDHVFARIASTQPRAFLNYFPHGHYSLGTTGLGPANEFGMRIHEDLEALEGRGKAAHKVIAVFGGSAVWGVSSYYDDCFTYLLEEKLNTEMASRGIKFSVLNFGLSGQILIDMMLTYINFVSALSPDIVISHDGQNDCVHGQLIDPYLLNKYRHNYMVQLELWAQKLMDAFDTPITQPGMGKAPGAEGYEQLRPLSTPPQVVRMYNFRKSQFFKMVRAEGSQFIWAQQPAAFGRRTPGALGKQLSAEEQDAHNSIWENHPFSDEVIKGLDLIYKQLTERLPDALPPEANFINFHKLFAEADPDTNLFYDHVHLAPAGEALVAETYFEKIMTDVLPDILPGLEC